MTQPGRGYYNGVIRARMVACFALVTLVSCAPSEPSAADWRAAAMQAVEDTASEVDTVALVLRLESDDRLPGRSARIAAVESEDSVATAEQTFSTQQPPDGSGADDAEVSDLIGRAADLVREARIVLTAGDEVAYDDVRQRLLDLSSDLRAELEALA